jgi:1-acyl-sn-glycerol-3-phosphate acyltransferase
LGEFIEMVRRSAIVWRSIRTGIAFLVFGVGAVIIAPAVFAVLGWGAASDRRERRAQWLVHVSFRFFVWFATRLGLIRVVSEGTERLRGTPPRLVIANHPTLLDVVLLIACMPQADCVVKQAWWRNPFLRWVVRGAGYLPNDEGDLLVTRGAERLRAGRWLLLFPEGTRSPRGGLGTFRRGAARRALASGAGVLPAIIRCDPPTLMKGQRWYEVPDRTMQFHVAVAEPIAVEVSRVTPRPVAVRQLTKAMRAFYEERVGDGRTGHTRERAEAAHH